MRWIVRSVVALVLALVTLAVLAAGALFLIPSERIAGLVVGQFKTLTGRELVIEGSVRPTVWPVLGVKTGKVSISNADWSDLGPMFQAEALEIAPGTVLSRLARARDALKQVMGVPVRAPGGAQVTPLRKTPS